MGVVSEMEKGLAEQEWAKGLVEVN